MKLSLILLILYSKLTLSSSVSQSGFRCFRVKATSFRHAISIQIWWGHEWLNFNDRYWISPVLLSYYVHSRFSQICMVHITETKKSIHECWKTQCKSVSVKHFYRTMDVVLAWYCYRKSTVHLSVMLTTFDVLWAHRFVFCFFYDMSLGPSGSEVCGFFYEVREISE